MIPIHSQQNRVIKELKALHSKKERDNQGKFIIEGIRFVNEAIENNQSISSIVVSDTLSAKSAQLYIQKATESKIPLYQIPERIFKEITDTVSPQGVLATIHFQPLALNSWLKESIPQKLLLLDRLQDPGNMGTIIRTADAFGFDTVIAIKGSVDIYNPKVLRSTMGAIFRVQCIQDQDVSNVFSMLHSKTYSIYATALNESDSIFDTVFKTPLCLVIGNEANGISKEILAHCNHKIKIPMQGKTESLNASIAGSIAMYEIHRSTAFTT